MAELQRVFGKIFLRRLAVPPQYIKQEIRE